MSPLIVALDYPALSEALSLAERLDPQRVRLKVGKELFTRAGPAGVEALQKRGFDIFLDLKFHDIPHTVAAALKAAAELGVWMVNVHASGGRPMLDAAVEALAGAAHRPRLIAVTVLTSMTAAQLAETGVTRSLADQVQELAVMAQQAGLDGVVCSAREAALLRARCGTEFLLVTPGIRPPGAALGDQSRVVTPAQAQALGVDYMVIGRPISQAQSPTAAVDEIIQSLATG